MITFSIVKCSKANIAEPAGVSPLLARFRRAFTPLFHRLDELMEEVAGVGEGRVEGLLTCLWEALTREVRELREAQEAGEDWAEEGALHMHRVVREIGLRMMEKAYRGQEARRGLGSEE